MSLDGKREKILWNRNEEHFDFITFDDDYLYGFYEKDEKAYVGGFLFKQKILKFFSLNLKIMNILIY